MERRRGKVGLGQAGCGGGKGGKVSLMGRPMSRENCGRAPKPKSQAHGVATQPHLTTTTTKSYLTYYLGR